MPHCRLMLMAALLVAGGLCACSSSKPADLLATGSNPVTDAPAPQALVPATPNERALVAGYTSAEASRCGYNFDPARHRAGYVSYETAQGTPAEELAKLEKTYDSTVTKVRGGIQNPEEYCTDSETEKIKKNLSKQLAGDYSLPGKRPPPPKSLWGTPVAPEKFDREKVLHPGSARSG